MDIDKKVDNYSDQIVAALEKNPDQVCFDDEDGVCLKVIEKFNLEKKLNGDAPPGITWQDLFFKKDYKINDKTKIEMLETVKTLYEDLGIKFK
jgi:hypothetical protein|tara:strand:+ start:156 stop:434 length:279 start_codon:yes stop_codon:yes gene_type:complete